MTDSTPSVTGSSQEVAGKPAEIFKPESRLSAGRVFAKTCHLLALGWTVFCVIGVLVGIAKVSDALGPNAGGAATIGVGIGLTFWAFAWFFPLVGLEVVALAAMAIAKKHSTDEATSKREWWRAVAFSALPNLLLVFAILGTVSSSSTSGTSSGAPAASSASRERNSDATRYTVRAADLYEEYEKNEVAADRKYKGHPLEVSGLVKDIGNDITNTPYVVLGENVDNPFGTQALFDDESERVGVARLSKGERVTVLCRGGGKLGNVLLRRCSLR